MKLLSPDESAVSSADKVVMPTTKPKKRRIDFMEKSQIRE
jgi:hypothetical protein